MKCKSKIGKPNRKIDFTKEANVSEKPTGNKNASNAASIRSRAKDDNASKIIDPCFKNVWATEQLKNKFKNKVGNSGRQSSKLTEVNLISLQDLPKTTDQLMENDGIVLDIDVEELDYIDDVDLDNEQSTIQPNCSNVDPGQLNDEELAKHPRVKNLFNQFWEEKMKEMSTRGNSNLGNTVDSNQISKTVQASRNKAVTVVSP